MELFICKHDPRRDATTCFFDEISVITTHYTAHRSTTQHSTASNANSLTANATNL